MPVWLLPDSPASTLIPAATSATAISLVGQSTSAIPVPLAGQAVGAIITDNGNPGYSAASPLATPYEGVQITANNQGTNTLTVVRGQFNTSQHSFFAGAQIACNAWGEVLTAMMARVDQGTGGLRLPGLAGVVGPPTTGTWGLGDLWYDSAGLGWDCTVAGAPGTWRRLDSWLGVAQGCTGAVPNGINQRLYTQAGSQTGNSNSGSQFTVTFPTPFPGGVLTVIATPGDASPNNKVAFQVAQNTVTTSTFAVWVVDSTNGSGMGIVAVRVNYIAVGW